MNKTTVNRFYSTTTAPTTMTPNFYLPDPAWALILEFHNAAPLRREKRAIAEACAECVRNEDRRRKRHVEVRDFLLECSQHPINLRLFQHWPAELAATFATATWEKVQKPHWHPDRRVPALIDLLKGSDSCGRREYPRIRRLKVPELKRLLKASGVRGYSKMRKQELIMAYVKL